MTRFQPCKLSYGTEIRSSEFSISFAGLSGLRHGSARSFAGEEWRVSFRRRRLSFGMRSDKPKQFFPVPDPFVRNLVLFCERLEPSPCLLEVASEVACTEIDVGSRFLQNAKVLPPAIVVRQCSYHRRRCGGLPERTPLDADPPRRQQNRVTEENLEQESRDDEESDFDPNQGERTKDLLELRNDPVQRDEDTPSDNERKEDGSMEDPPGSLGDAVSEGKHIEIWVGHALDA